MSTTSRKQRTEADRALLARIRRATCPDYDDIGLEVEFTPEELDRIVEIYRRTERANFTREEALGSAVADFHWESGMDLSRLPPRRTLSEDEQRAFQKRREELEARLLERHGPRYGKRESVPTNTKQL